MRFIKIVRLLVCAAGAVLIICSPYSAVKTGKESRDCLDYGNSRFPLWSHLTAPEIKTLESIESARAGNPDALLDLAIFASGNVRDSAAYAACRNKVTSFVASIHPEADTVADPIRKGRVIYEKICRTFYGASFMNDPLTGYQLDQSQLTEVFRTQKMNCISSTLLCVVIFRYFNFDINGMTLPNHVFAQFKTESGKIVDIETTTGIGYDFKHDDEFFGSKMAKWWKDHNLDPITREQYKQREQMSPFELVCYNFSNQHSMEDRMAQCDRYRLSEVYGYLYRDEPEKFNHCLTVYINSFGDFDRSSNNTDAIKMFSKVADSTLACDAAHTQNKSVFENVLIFRMCWAVALAKNGFYQAALAKIDSVIAAVDTSSENYHLFSDNTTFVYFSVAIALTDQNKFNDALAIYRNAPRCVQSRPSYRTNMHYLYNAMLNAAFKQENYDEAIARGFEAVQYGDSSTLKADYENIQAAYLNLARKYSLNKKTAEVKKVLDECIRRIPECEKCREQLKKI